MPGDLGRPIVAAQGSSSSSALGIDAEQQRVNQESEAARISKVFASTNVRPPAVVTSPGEAPSTASSSSDEAFAQNAQERKLAFVNTPVDKRTTSFDRLANPASPFVVQAGTVIPAALITGIRSDLPGQITAQVTESVYDSPTGRARLIPRGARLIGTYDSQVAFGQSRVLLVWTRLIMPNGRSIVLERQPGADAAGYSGLEDQVDTHWRELLGAAALSTLVAVGTEVNSSADTGNANSDLVAALRRGAGDSINQTGQQEVRRNLNIQPTLTIRPGFPVRVIVNRDLVLEPYRG
ncbi:type IV secretory pathway VirB10-like protein [Bradyrhizobium sp. i1.15.2]